MKAILDTNLLVAESLSHVGYEVTVSSLSWAELGYGIRTAASRVQRAHREARVSVSNGLCKGVRVRLEGEHCDHECDQP